MHFNRDDLFGLVLVAALAVIVISTILALSNSAIGWMIP